MQSLTRQTLKIFWQHARKYRWQVFLIFGSVLIVTAVQTGVATLYRNLVDVLASGTAQADIAPAVHLILLILGINLIEVVFWRVADLTNNYFLPKVMSELTNTCYQYLQQHSYGFFTSKFIGSLVTKVKRVERAFEVFVNQLFFSLGRTFVITAMILVVLLAQYPLFGFIILGWCAVYLVFVYYFARFKMPYDIRRAHADTHTTGELADGITNNVNLKVFTSYATENGRFAGVTEKQFRVRKKSWDIGVIGEFVQGLLVVALEFFVVYLSVKQWQQGLISIGGVTLLQVYLFRIIEKLWDTGKNIRALYESLADANEMTELLLKPHDIKDVPGAVTLGSVKGKVEFKDISFGYHDGSAVLEKFNLSINPGERVALIGPSGGGKSTILKLLLRFYDVNSGTIAIDGQDISKATQDSVRSALSLVPQDPILFHRTLAENIRYAKPDATDQEVVEAARLAHAHEFISKSQHGYQTLVGERGIKLSGGERQRVAIARAILKDAPILILDEATSSLDSESEMFIQDALKNLMKGRTTIVVAHRLSTIMQMDRIVVIADGKIIEEGKHEELLKAQQGTYQKLWNIQAGGFASA